MSVSLKIENISKTYGKSIALNKVNLEINKGELICLLGPSGCGKSTLLRMIAGLDKPNEGRIYMNDRDVTKRPPASRKYGIMFQSYALFPNLTAFENVVYALRNKKISNKVIEERAQQLFQMIHLKDVRNKYPSELSGGEQQRIALARSLADEPEFLLLDEPLSALDAKVRASLRSQICEIQRELNLTTIMVTHDQEEALTMADRIVVMNKSCIMQVGTPEEVYLNPVNPFVADFVGNINFFADADGQKVKAIRPEKIKIKTEHSADCVAGKITNMEFRGQSYRICVEVSELLSEGQFFVDVPFGDVMQDEIAVGKQVYLQVDEKELLYYDMADMEKFHVNMSRRKAVREYE